MHSACEWKLSVKFTLLSFVSKAGDEGSLFQRNYVFYGYSQLYHCVQLEPNAMIWMDERMRMNRFLLKYSYLLSQPKMMKNRKVMIWLRLRMDFLFRGHLQIFSHFFLWRWPLYSIYNFSSTTSGSSTSVWQLQCSDLHMHTNVLAPPLGTCILCLRDMFAFHSFVHSYELWSECHSSNLITELYV